MTHSAIGKIDQVVRRVLQWLLVCAALETGLVIVHAQYGAHHYENPGLQHASLVVVFWLLLASLIVASYARRPSNVKRLSLIAVVGVPFIGIFGLVHGAIGHGVKLVFFAAGTAQDQLGALFNLGDFVVPDDAFFESTGVATFLASILVSVLLWRFAQMTRPSSIRRAGVL